MKHNPSLLLFLFIHRLEEIPQFHLLLFSVILSKMKINPLFYVRCVLMRVCALDPLITSSLGLCHPQDYFSTLCDILKNYLQNQIKIRQTIFHFATIQMIRNVEVIAWFILASVLPSSCLKGFQLFDFGKRYVNKDY